MLAGPEFASPASAAADASTLVVVPASSDVET
jgi:hypothetical protein